MMLINGDFIGPHSKPYVIAELSANHGGSLENALNAISLAKQCGASAVKIQTYTPDTMTINSNKPDFCINGGLWDGYTLYDLYGEAFTPYDWHSALFDHARDIGISIFSTPFDETAVDLLESLNTPAYKIASFELTDLPLISYVAQTGKPMLMSTGMASDQDIDEAVETAFKHGCPSLLLFHCVSCYPAKTEDYNLLRLKRLADKYNVLVGLSDHTIDNVASSLAISLGAVAIEKHFTPDKAIQSADSAFSLDPSQFKEFSNIVGKSWCALGSGEDIKSTDELKNLRFRRSIYFVNNLKAGTTISESDIRRIRPGYGLKPRFFMSVLGKTVLRDVEAGDPVTFEILNPPLTDI